MTMRRTALLSLLGLLLGLGLAVAADQSGTQDAEAPARPESHTTVELAGWTIRVDDRLRTGPDKELGDAGLKFLEAKLLDITRVLPEDKVQALQKVTIYLQHSNSVQQSLAYHPSAVWLKKHGWPTQLARCVEIGSAQHFLSPRNTREQPWVVLHELAHAYHHQVLGYNDKRIIQAFEAYKAGGNGDKTLLHNGKRVKHYALTNAKEFFAEMTEAYFGVNDFFPFNRAELMESEPDIYNLMKEIWESPPPQPAEGAKAQ